jgi:small-conductance mechanosensitive channel
MAMEREATNTAEPRGGQTLPARVRAARLLAIVGIVTALGLAVDAVAAGQETVAGRLYRYRNAEGAIEMSNAVPAERVAGGYEVLDKSGNVIERVEPQLTAEELAAKVIRDRKVAECRQHVERVSSLYGTVADITAAAEQAQKSIEARIANLEGSLALERRRLEERESDAAQRERTGRKITRELQQSIDLSRAQIESIGREIAQRHAEQQTAKARFAEDRRLFENGDCGTDLAQGGP